MSTKSKRQSAKNAAVAIAFDISTRSPTKKQPSTTKSKSKPKRQPKNSLNKPSSSKSLSKQRGLIDGEDVYAVKRLLDKRTTSDGRIEYLVEWKGWSSRYNQWEPKENIISSELIKDFENEKKQNNSN